MTGSRIILALSLACALSAHAQTTLYVNAATGNDAVSKAANSAAAPWRSIGRAVWGSTDRSSPVASEAASAGDTVLVAGGTYTTSVATNNRWAVVYNPTNSGTQSQPITITCVGNCLLGAPNANAPIIGADGRDYIKWYADIGQGHAWTINAYGREAGSAGPNEVNTTPDTGPVVCHVATGCWVEGARIDGGLQTDYTDNYNAFRYENCTACTIRNNTIRNFRNFDNTGNGTAVTLYGSPNALVEHNFATNVGSGIAVKDHGSTLPQNAVVFRFNKFDNADRCISTSTTAEGRNYFYQNLCVNGVIGLHVTGGGFSSEWYFNNTFYNYSGSGVYLASPVGSGGRFWNNIVVTAARIVELPATMPSDAVVDLEHNVYQGFVQFYTGTDGDRSFASFKSAYPTHDQAAPASVETNPILVNPAAGDFRLCMGAGTPSAGCTGATTVGSLGIDLLDLDGDGSTGDPVNPGAFITNAEVMGPTTAAAVSRPRAPTNLRVVSP